MLKKLCIINLILIIINSVFLNTNNYFISFCLSVATTFVGFAIIILAIRSMKK